MARMTIDLGPMKKYRDFRFLWTSGLISNLGSLITYVAIPFQIKELTHSYLAVGISGAVELLPLIFFGLYGGVLADAVDRKKMVWATEAAALVLTSTLLANSMRAHPSLLLIYIVAGLFAACDGLQRPSADAMLPRLVGHSDLPSASALMSLRRQFAVIVGPAIGGVIIASSSVSVGYGADVFSFVLSLILLWQVGSVPPHELAEKPSLAALFEGLRYAMSRQDLLGTYVIDLAAMFFAMPNALFPFWADALGAPWALGFFYAAATVGALVITLTSGWMKSYRFHGRAITIAAIGWGGAIACAGIVHSLPLVLLFLAIAGASDMVSALFRSAIWNQTIPDQLRGRLAGIELLSYSVGPLAGQLRAASIASATSLSFSVTSGGLICVFMVVLLAGFLPKFRKYDLQTNEFAIQERKNRESRNFE
ncbi:MAG: MFS transporter [Actinomycetes bacterium]|nr:MFS transporter [Actinomycetota bacterium]